jgi:hypothetical protein
MSLKRWFENGWLRRHQTSSQEIADLMMIVDRDLQDAKAGVSDDWRSVLPTMPYNAALKLCTILLYAESYRAERALQHYRTIQALPLILGDSRKGDADYLDTCRTKRNIVEYDQIGVVSEAEADELIAFVEEFRGDVQGWLKSRYPELLSPRC